MNATTKTLTHSGAVVFREGGPQILYLVVSSSDGLYWVLPKGHIDPDETPETTAVRELQEEAGVIGEILDRLSVQRYTKVSGTEIALQYFLLRDLGPTEAAEQRTLRWEDERAALELLTYKEARDALLEGAAIVRRQ